jgi:hypothetical protein
MTFWSADLSIVSWWTSMSSKNVPNRKLLASLAMSPVWIIWNETNANFPQQLKTEAKLWLTAGAKRLCFVLTGMVVPYVYLFFEISFF